MRVITGSARGRRLKELEGMETRPTTDRVKEGLFNVLQFDIEGRKVLDLFAGTGQLGIECLSQARFRCVCGPATGCGSFDPRKPEALRSDGPEPGSGRGFHGISQGRPGKIRPDLSGPAL